MHTETDVSTREQTGLHMICCSVPDESRWSPAGWDALRKSGGRGLAACRQMREGARLVLAYDIDSLVSLHAILPTLTPGGFRTVLIRLVDALLWIERNPALSAEHLSGSFDRMFVDADTLDVHLIYQPLAITDAPGSRLVFERLLREKLLSALVGHQNLEDDVNQAVRDDLASGQVPLAVIRDKLAASCGADGRQALEPIDEPAPLPHLEPPDPFFAVADPREAPRPDPVPEPVYTPAPPDPGFRPHLALELAGAPGVFSLIIDRPEYILGKSPKAAHGVIPQSPFISKRHCELRWVGGHTYLTDLNSLNGSCVNGIPLDDGESRPVRAGDLLRLADCDFVLRAI